MPNLETSTCQDDESQTSNCHEEEDSLAQPIPEITTKTTTKTTTKKEIPFSNIISYLNEKTNAVYRPGTKKTKELITARWNEGFGLEDFKRVIDLKTAEWLNDPTWNKYLRPETLFGTKFESYLNQKTGKKIWREEDFDLDD